MSEVQDGDWVQTRPFGHRGTVELGRFGATIVLDPDHGHFTDRIGSSLDELKLVRDAEMEDAQNEIDHQQARIKQIDYMIRFHQSERRKAIAELAEARKQMREARKLPRRRPDAS